MQSCYILQTMSWLLLMPNSTWILYCLRNKTYSTPEKSYACTVQTLSSSYSILCLVDYQVGHADTKGQLHFVLWSVLFYPIVLAQLLLHLDGNIHPWRSDLIWSLSGCLDRTVECTERQYMGGWKRPDSHRKVTLGVNWGQYALFRATPCFWLSKALQVTEKPCWHPLS